MGGVIVAAIAPECITKRSPGDPHMMLKRDEGLVIDHNQGS